MHSLISKRHTDSQGFTLLELVALLSMLSGLIFVLVYKTTDLSIQRAILASNSSLAAADAQLMQFAAWNGRFPCPDTTGDGVEDCTSSESKGALPYRTLGLSALGYQPGEQGERGLKYGIYRNTAADLAVQKEVFKPTDADLKAYNFGNKNSLDLCQALEAADALAVSTNYLYVQQPNAAKTAVAYVLSNPGARDADGINGPYDGLNGSSATGFNRSETPVSDTYDDQTLSRGFNDVFRLLHCEVSQRSLNLTANAIALETDNINFANTNKDSADEGVIMNAVGTGLALWSLAQAGAALSSATEVSAVSAGLLATATSTCAIPPFVGCALIPVYTTAVAAASSGATLSGIALGLAGTAVGLQTAATIMYIETAGKTGASDTPPASTGVTQAMIDDAEAAYTANNQTAAQAEAAYSTALANYTTGTLATSNSTLATLKTEINKLDMLGEDVTDLRNELYGFPRPEDWDPNNPPNQNDVVLGALTAIDSWISAESDATRMANVDLGGVDLDTTAAEAQLTASTEIDEARTEVKRLCSLSLSCDLLVAFDEHITTYPQERIAWYEVEVLGAQAEQARDTADGSYDKWLALKCAANGQGYDSDTKSCTALNTGAPSGAQPGELVQYFSGMDDLVRQLDGKGSVR